MTPTSVTSTSVTSTSLTIHPPLSRTVVPHSSLLTDGLLVLMGSVLMALLTQVKVPLPFTPVPITGQTLGVLLVGITLGSRLGFVSLWVYLAEGIAGLPVFAGASGIVPAGFSVILGPTGGYLLAYPLAAALVGYAVERFGADRHPLKLLAAMSLATLVIYAIGVPWLGAWMVEHDKFGGFFKLLMAGMLPFLPGDLIKMGLCGVSLPLVWRILGRSKP